jgi:hypothetical protein
MALAPNTKPYLTGGLQDSAVDAGLQKFVPEIWGEAIMDYMEKKLVVGSLAQDLSSMVANGGDLIHLPKHDEIAAADLYGGNVEALQATAISFDDTTTAGGEYQLIVNQSAYAAVAIADLVMAQGASEYDFMNMYTQKLGYALGKHIEAYIMYKLLNHVGFNYTDGTDDGAGSGNNISFTTGGAYTITKDGVAAMIQAVYESDADLEDFVAVLCPATYASLFKLDDFARYDVIGNSLGTELPRVSGYVGKLGGVDVVVSNNFRNKDNSAYLTAPVFNKANGTVDESDQLAGFLIRKDAIKIAYAKGMKARVQSDYSLTTLSTQFVADSVYGCAIVGDNSTNKTVFALCDA